MMRQVWVDARCCKEGSLFCGAGQLLLQTRTRNRWHSLIRLLSEFEDENSCRQQLSLSQKFIHLLLSPFQPLISSVSVKSPSATDFLPHCLTRRRIQGCHSHRPCLAPGHYRRPNAGTPGTKVAQSGVSPQGRKVFFLGGPFEGVRLRSRPLFYSQNWVCSATSVFHDIWHASVVSTLYRV
jgi:hypothetical protein